MSNAAEKTDSLNVILNENLNRTEEQTFPCMKCAKRFRTPRGALQHQRQCKANVRVQEEVGQPPPSEILPHLPHKIAPRDQVHEKFYWGEKEGSVFTHQIDVCYEKIVFWRRNLFMLPNGAAGKNFIREITRLLNAWVEKSPLRVITMKAIHIMPALLLQKPSKNSKSKDHLKALERRLELWHKGEIEGLLNEAEALQSRLPQISERQDIETISKRFKNMMQKGNVNGAIKLLTNNMAGGVLPLNDDTIEILREKHPIGGDLNEDNALQGPYVTVNPIIYDVIDDSLVLRAALTTKGGSGPSGLDADGWRKPLTSKVYGDCGGDLRTAIANVIKKLCTEYVDDESLEGFLACRLVPLNKRPGVRPIGVGEVLRRICGKVIMAVMREDVIKSCSKIQMCAGQRAGSEAAIHAMRDMFESEESEAVLLVDAANAFNSINRRALIHNIRILCPILSNYVTNCYNIPARLFVIGGIELRSKEGTTQGDPIGMAMYAIGITPLLELMLTVITGQDQMVAFADDLTAVGKCESLILWWENLKKKGHCSGTFRNLKNRG